MNRRGEIERFLRSSGLPLGERAVVRDLRGCADNRTGEILPEHEWKTSLDLIAERLGCPKSNVVLWLDHLERHGVIRRIRSRGGQGNRTKYFLLPPGARPCDCPSRVRDEPKTAAERMRAYRRRKRSAERNAEPSTVTTRGPFERSVARNENVARPGPEYLGTSPRREGFMEGPPLPPEMVKPCGWCGRPCRRYGPGGGPVCGECLGSAR
jgi:hypothetical protein